VAVCRLLFAACCLLFATAAARNLCSHGAFDKIENSFLAESKFPPPDPSFPPAPWSQRAEGNNKNKDMSLKALSNIMHIL